MEDKYPGWEYQRLFDHFKEEYSLILTKGDMDDIINICAETIILLEGESFAAEFEKEDHLSTTDSILKCIIDKWGEETQIIKIQEEALELALAINNRSIPTKNQEKVSANIYEELADMKIMMMQAEMIFDSERINKQVKYKLERVKTYLK